MSLLMTEGIDSGICTCTSRLLSNIAFLSMCCLLFRQSTQSHHHIKQIRLRLGALLESVAVTCFNSLPHAVACAYAYDHHS